MKDRGEEIEILRKMSLTSDLLSLFKKQNDPCKGRKSFIQRILEDIGKLRLKNLKVLDLDLFYSQSEIPNYKKDLQNLFKEVFPGVHILMRSNDDLLHEFSL